MVRDTPKRALIALHREWIGSVIQRPHMTAKQVWRLFQEQTGIGVVYCTTKRYLRGVFKFGSPATTVRMEVVSGSQAQVGFGHVGTMIDPATGRLRRVWAFVMTLSYSRHRFVRFVFGQDGPTSIDCHIRAFEFFQGVPATVVLGNLKSGVIKPDIYDPLLNRAYGELKRPYGFVADPAKVRR
jgi:transposase